LNTATPLGNELSGTGVTVEDFTIELPASGVGGAYTIQFGTLASYDDVGGPLTTAAGNTFTVNVVPEPCTILLFAAGLGGGALFHRRQRRREQQT